MFKYSLLISRTSIIVLLILIVAGVSLACGKSQIHENALYKEGLKWRYHATYRKGDSISNYYITLVPGGSFLAQQKI